MKYFKYSVTEIGFLLLTFFISCAQKPETIRLETYLSESDVVGIVDLADRNGNYIPLDGKLNIEVRFKYFKGCSLIQDTLLYSETKNVKKKDFLRFPERNIIGYQFILKDCFSKYNKLFWKEQEGINYVRDRALWFINVDEVKEWLANRKIEGTVLIEFYPTVFYRKEGTYFKATGVFHSKWL